MYEYLKNKSVLYVEDDEEVLNNISKLLKKFFKEFYTAKDGVSALDIFYEHKFDILLVDIELPKMSGIELIREVRKIDEDVKIIIISAYTKTDYLLESVELWLSKYIVKPLTSSKIHLVLETINSYYMEHGKLDFCGFSLDKNGYKLTYNDKTFELSKKEVKFLNILFNHKIITYEEIYNIWEDNIPSDSAIRSFVKYLRKKLPESVLKNKSGIGYYLECKDEEIN
jgi:DNA-binding response OmpR family regulator